MKILLCLPEFPPQVIGGGGIVYQQLTQQYLRHQHQVIVFYADYVNRSFFKRIIKYHQHQVTFYRLPLLPNFPDLAFLRARLPPTITAWKQLDQIISIEKPDIAHLHGHDFFIIDLIANKLKKHQIPYIMTLHNWPIRQKENPIIKLLWPINDRFFIKPALQNATRLTTVSQFIKSHLPKELQKKTTVIPNGIRNYKLKYEYTNTKTKKNRAKMPVLSYSREAPISGVSAAKNGHRAINKYCFPIFSQLHFS